MWDDIDLRRREDGSIPPVVRSQLLSKTDDEVEQAVAYILEQEMKAVFDARDPSKRDGAKAVIADLERLRELLRVRAYLVQVDRVWQALPHDERVALIDHLDRLGAPPVEDAAKSLLSMSIAQMAIGTIVGGAEQASGRKTTVEKAMTGMLVTFQLLAIRQAGDYHAAQGQALKLVGVRKRRRWFGR